MSAAPVFGLLPLLFLGCFFASVPSAHSQPPPYSVNPIFVDKAPVSADDLVVAGSAVFWVGWARNDYAVLGHRIDEQGRLSEFLTVSLTTASPDFQGDARLTVNKQRSHIYVSSNKVSPVVWVLRFADPTLSTYLGATVLRFDNKTAGPASELDFSDTTLFVGTTSGSVTAVDLGTLQPRMLLGSTPCTKANGLVMMKYSSGTDSLILSCGSSSPHRISLRDRSDSKLKFAIRAPMMRKDGAMYFFNGWSGNGISVTFPSDNYATYSSVQLSQLLCPSAKYYLSSNQIDVVAVCQESIFVINGRTLSVNRVSLPSIPSQSLYFVSMSKYLTTQGYPVLYLMIEGSLKKLNGTQVTEILSPTQISQMCNQPNTGFEIDTAKGPWEFVTACLPGWSPMLIRQNAGSAATGPAPDSQSTTNAEAGTSSPLPAGAMVGIVLAALCGCALIAVVCWRMRKTGALNRFNAPLISEGSVDL